MNRQSFTVDLHGVVELLSSHLYSGPQVFLRELLQNAVDAIAAADAPDSGHVVVEAGRVGDRPALTVVDNGIGLSAGEAAAFMGVIGRSSKRDEIGMARESFIGQFGVGILSCFAVSDRITVTSRSVKGGPAVRWIGDAAGTWSVEECADDLSSTGTRVTLVARHGEDRWFAPDTVLRALTEYGELLSTPVFFTAGGSAAPTLVTRPEVPLRDPYATQDELLALGRELLGIDALDAFPVAAPSSGTRGIAYVLPYEPAPGTARADRVYVKGMLVTPECDRLLPEWAFFIRCVVESDGLHPTASREELHHDDALDEARHELGEAIRRHLVGLARSGSPRLRDLVATHHLSLKALAVTDPEFCALVADWLPVKAAQGWMSLGEFRHRYPVALYTRTVDEFRQLAPVAIAQDVGLVCGGYTFDAELIAAASNRFPDFCAEPANVEDLFRGFGLLTRAQRWQMAQLEELARERLADLDVDVAVRRFEPAETPALLALSNDAAELRSLKRASEQVGDLFGGIIGTIADTAADVRPIFCLNADNPIVARLAGVTDDEELVVRSIEILYLQSLLAGHHPLRAEESVMLNSSLLAILGRATGAPS